MNKDTRHHSYELKKSILIVCAGCGHVWEMLVMEDEALPIDACCPVCMKCLDLKEREAKDYEMSTGCAEDK